MPPNPIGQSHATIPTDKRKGATGRASNPNEIGTKRIVLKAGGPPERSLQGSSEDACTRRFASIIEVLFDGSDSREFFQKADQFYTLIRATGRFQLALQPKVDVQSV